MVSAISGFIGIAIYLILTIISWSFYPYTFNPLHNWLSDLGNTTINPGSLYYRLASISCGVCLIGFYLFLGLLTKDDRKKFHVYTWIVRVFGILGAISFIMSGVFPINDLSNHSFWSKMLYILFGTSIAFSGIIWIYDKKMRLLSISVFLICIVDIFSGIFTQIYILEWIVVSLIILYILFLCIRNVTYRARGPINFNC